MSALLFVLAFSSSALAATSLSKLVAQYSDLKPGASHSAADLTFTVGHMTFAGGGTATVLNAGDPPVGLFLTGGAFTYELAGKDELAAVRYNAKHGDVTFVVALAAPAPPNQPLKVRFEIDGNFLYRHEKTNFLQLGITPWFPWVQMHEQRYTFHAVVKVDKPFVVFASGKTIRRADEGDYHLVETKLDQPERWVAILRGSSSGKTRRSASPKTPRSRRRTGSITPAIRSARWWRVRHWCTSRARTCSPACTASWETRPIPGVRKAEVR